MSDVNLKDLAGMSKKTMTQPYGLDCQGDKPKPAESDKSDDKSLDLLASQSSGSISSTSGEVEFLAQKCPPPKSPSSTSSSSSAPSASIVTGKENLKPPARTPAEQRRHVLQKAASRSGFNVPHPKTQSPKHQPLPSFEEEIKETKKIEALSSINSSNDEMPVPPVKEVKVKQSAAELKARQRWPDFKTLAKNKDGSRAVRAILTAVDDLGCTSELKASRPENVKGNTWSKLHHHLFIGNIASGRAPLEEFPFLPPLSSPVATKSKMLQLCAFLRDSENINERMSTFAGGLLVEHAETKEKEDGANKACLLYTSPSPRD